MNQMRKLLFILYGLFIVCLVFMAMQEGESNSTADGCSGFIILIYLGLFVITYKYAKYTNRNAILYVIGTLIMPYLIPLILALLPKKTSRTATEQFSRPPSGVQRTPASTAQTQQLFDAQPGTVGSASSTDQTEVPMRVSGNTAAYSSVPQSEQSVLDSQFSILKMSNNYRLAMKGLKPGAIGSIIFGLIAIMAGTVTDGVLGPVSIIVGLLLIVEGIWILRTRRLDWLIYEGFALVVIGALNILLTVQDLLSEVGSGQGTGHFLGLGVIQIIFGWKSIVRYQHFSELPMMKPTDAINTTIINLVYGVTSANIKQDPELIEFKTVEFRGRKSWKARLSGNSGTFVEGNEKDVIMEKRASIQIIPEGEFLPNAMTKMTIRMGEKTYNGTINHENFTKYKDWKK